MNAHTSLTSQLVRRISDTIRRRKLAEGAFFMTEEQIAQKYGTSRRVAREAVAHLTSLGVLRSRRGQGISVGRPDPTGLLQQTVPFLAQKPQDLNELAELRYCLEVGVAELAVAHATEDQVQRLESIAAQLSQICDPEQPGNLYELECAFHGQILEATGNRLIMGMHGVIQNFFAAQRHRIADAALARQLLAESAQEHLAIAAAFRARDAARAAALLRRHLAVNTQAHAGAGEPANP
jgi:GntR family transcriptional repressor for pyruvate dehydrogenase complex